MRDDCSVVCENFQFENIDIDCPCCGCFLGVRRFCMETLCCTMGDSPQGDCFAQLHLRARFFLTACFENGAARETCFEKCLTFTVPRGVFCRGRFDVEGMLCSVHARRSRCGVTLCLSTKVCLIADPWRGGCFRDCESACGCDCDCKSDCDCKCGCGGACGCAWTMRSGGVTLPYSLMCGQDGCGCSCASSYTTDDGAWAARPWTLPDGSTYTADLQGACGCRESSCGCQRNHRVSCLGCAQ